MNNCASNQYSHHFSVHEHYYSHLYLTEMKYSHLFIVLAFCVVICSAAEEESHYSRYESACPGTIEDETKSFRQFIDKYFSNTTTGLIGSCEPSYFSDVSGTTCDENAVECVVCVLFWFLKLRAMFNSSCGTGATGDFCTMWDWEIIQFVTTCLDWMMAIGFWKY